MQNIQNIIFDLGGVILDIDFKRTELAFAALGMGNFNQYYTLQTVTPVFEKLETGHISPEAFYDQFRQAAQLQLSNEQIMHAWNALLLDFTPARIDLVKQLKERYHIYLLSNTNQIHYNYFTNAYKQQVGGNFDDLFVKAYYSHQLGLRKPSKEIFKKVIQDENLQAAETVFIDDSEANINAAASVGLQTIHLSTPKTILDLGL
jgi:epoxide hydrolase-like predicted phosphatase